VLATAGVVLGIGAMLVGVWLLLAAGAALSWPPNLLGSSESGLAEIVVVLGAVALVTFLDGLVMAMAAWLFALGALARRLSRRRAIAFGVLGVVVAQAAFLIGMSRDALV
jgi:hypothetical protein